jgi:type III restriction enzyme
VRGMPEVKQPVLRSDRVRIQIDGSGVDGHIVSSGAHVVDLADFKMPDLIGYIQKKTELTRHTIHDVLVQSDRLKDALVNPQLFLDMVVNEIIHVLNSIMIDGIKYQKIGHQEYEMRRFDIDDLEIYTDALAFAVKDQNKTIYENFIPLDSTVEENFARECEEREDVEFFFKLPRWFTIDTPLGTYRPDWALIFKNEKKIYFVAETKGTIDMHDLRPDEEMKVKCGQAHFKEFDNVEYRLVKSVSDLS